MKIKTLFEISAIIPSCLWLTAYGPRMQIRYSMKDIPASSTNVLKDKTISIEYFQDVRKEKSENAALFDNEHDTKVEGKHVCLLDKNGNVAKTLEDVKEKVDGPLSADAYCWAIYFHVNDTLKHAVQKMAEAVEKGLVSQ